MYSEYFGLQEMPFSIAPDPRFLYMSKQHREALAHLIYGFNSDGGFVLLTGEVGTGKTTVCRCLLEQIPENSAIAYILNPKLTVEELLATICDEFGISYPKDNPSIKLFVDLINEFLLDAHSGSRKTVLIIDEAQNLSEEVLEQLRLLTNLETNQHKLLQIILLGQPELRDKLSRPELRQLSQRIIARYHLGPLSKKDLDAYIRHRLTVAGLRKQLFLSSTINKLYRLSGGVPRLINVLCDRALLGTFVQGKDRINKSTLTKAAREVFGETNNGGRYSRKSIWFFALVVLSVFGIVIAATFYKNETLNVQNVSANIPGTQEVLKLDTVQWPDDQPINQSMNTAYQALFEYWGISYQPRDTISACRHAQKNGLRCLNELGSLSSLHHLNRPAVLKLFDDNAQEYYAALTNLGAETATLIVASETREVSIKDIESRWFGDYTLLWRVPPYYRGNIQRGNRGSAVNWLSRQLDIVLGREGQERENSVFDNDFVVRVKKFQLAEGLIPDGIVGTKTLIHINTRTGKGIPTLTDKKGYS